MKTIALSLLLSTLSVSLYAQCLTLGEGFNIKPMHTATGDADLDRAMTICEHHMRGCNTIPDSHTYPDEYKACYKVEAKWEKSDAARRIAEEKDREQRDLDFLNAYVK